MKPIRKSTVIRMGKMGQPGLVFPGANGGYPGRVFGMAAGASPLRCKTATIRGRRVRQTTMPSPHPSPFRLASGLTRLSGRVAGSRRRKGLARFPHAAHAAHSRPSLLGGLRCCLAVAVLPPGPPVAPANFR